ncbi:MAG: 4-phosphoerythronate dehydrogenase [Pseudomonadota bacterium]
MSVIKILADENMRGLEEAFASLGELVTAAGRDIRGADLKDVDVLLVRSVTRVDAALLEGSAVKFVGTATAGYDHVDRSYLGEHDIGFAAAPGANANAVVEYVLAAIAACDDHLERLFDGGRVGIVGAGHVGSLLARRLASLGVEYVAYDPWLAADTVPHAAALEDVLSSQVVTLHPELTQREPWPSRHLLEASRLAGIKAPQLLINASRGPVIDGRALLERLRAEDSPNCVLDVWEDEPSVNPALYQRCFLGTAHIAGYSLDAKRRATEMLATAVCAHFGREPPVTDDSSKAPDLRLGQTPEPLAGLRRLILDAYDIGLDHQLLGQALNAAHSHQEFDLLRRDYRDRRELCGRRVLGDFTPEMAGVIHALGCHSAQEPQ